jgi:hypothetical protein
MPDTDDEVARGVTVYDESSERFGTVADTGLGTNLVFLRPLGGGLEWRARREHIRPALASELLADRLRGDRAARGSL